MSPRPLQLPARPSGVRVVPGGAEAALDELVAARMEEARRAGVEEGRRLARSEEAGLLDAARRELDRVREEAADSLARTSAQLATEVARKLLHREVVAENYDLESIVREVLSASGVERGRCVVHLNPKDVERLADVGFRSGTELEGDPDVPPGDVHVTTSHGLLVRELEGIVTEIGERLLGDLR